MSNGEVTEILKSAQLFWIKWRDSVPDLKSDSWDLILQEVNEILKKYGNRKVYREMNGIIKLVEEPAAGPIIFYFLDLLHERAGEKSLVR